MYYLPNDKDKMRTLILILIGLSAIFAGCGKRDVISGLPAIDKKEEPVLETMPAKSLSEVCFVVGITAVAVLAAGCFADASARLLINRFPWMKKYIGFT
jgi:histidinol dehydrogenase